MATINLAPSTQYLSAMRRRRRRLFLLIFLLMVVIGGAWGVLVVWRQQATRKMADAQVELRLVQQRITELGPDLARVTAFEQRLAALDDLLDRHVSWAPLLTDLERLLPQPTVLKSIEAEASTGEMNVTGTTPTIDEIAQTLASVESQTDRATKFTRASLASVKRKEVTAPDSPVVTINYEFSATFYFAPQTIMGAQVRR